MENLTKEMEIWDDGFIGTGMSNCDGGITPGFEEALRAAPGKVYGLHAAWEFNGHVWFDGEKFIEQPWRHHVPREPISAPTLDELRRAVNDEWGWE